MSTLGSFISDIGGATGDKGTYSPVDVVKSQPLQGNIDQLISQYQNQIGLDSSSLSDYIKNYMAGNTAARQQAGQETTAIDRYYNGDVARQLADLRAQQAQLGNQSVAQALAYQRGNMNRSLVGGGGGAGNSYLSRLGLNTAADLNLQNNLALLGQNRADINQVNQGQLGLIGQRTAIANALAARPLAPAQAGQQFAGWESGDLNSLVNASNNNNLFGARYNPSQAEWGGAITNSGVGIGTSVMGMLGGIGGMGGGMGMGMGGMGGGGGGGGSPQPNFGEATFASGGPTGYYSGYGGGGYGPPAPMGYSGYQPTTLDMYNNMMANPSMTAYGPGTGGSPVYDYNADLASYMGGF